MILEHTVSLGVKDFDFNVYCLTSKYSYTGVQISRNILFLKLQELTVIRFVVI